jgi:protein-S-isoprenylcysteine O-methyltransferase Ste14
MPAPACPSIAAPRIDTRPPERRLFRLAYVWRGTLAAVPILLAAVIPWHLDLDPLHTWVPGSALVLLGWTLRMWAQCHLGYRLRARKKVVGCGPYAWVRNPIYLANTSMIAGTVMACGTLWLVPISVVWCAVLYSGVVRREEWLLALHYGDPYVGFLTRTPRWIPRRASDASFRAEPCRHHRLGAAVVAELHTPLILAPALLKWLVLWAVL